MGPLTEFRRGSTVTICGWQARGRDVLPCCRASAHVPRDSLRWGQLNSIHKCTNCILFPGDALRDVDTYHIRGCAMQQVSVIKVSVANLERTWQRLLRLGPLKRLWPSTYYLAKYSTPQKGPQPRMTSSLLLCFFSEGYEGLARVRSRPSIDIVQNRLASRLLTQGIIVEVSATLIGGPGCRKSGEAHGGEAHA